METGAPMDDEVSAHVIETPKAKVMNEILHAIVNRKNTKL